MTGKYRAICGSVKWSGGVVTIKVNLNQILRSQRYLTLVSDICINMLAHFFDTRPFHTPAFRYTKDNVLCTINAEIFSVIFFCLFNINLSFLFFISVAFWFTSSVQFLEETFYFKTFRFIRKRITPSQFCCCNRRKHCTNSIRQFSMWKYNNSTVLCSNQKNQKQDRTKSRFCEFPSGRNSFRIILFRYFSGVFVFIIIIIGCLISWEHMSVFIRTPISILCRSYTGRTLYLI